MSPSYIQADEVAKMIKEGAKPGKDFAIVDVRDDDFAGGNIPGAFHVPSASIDSVSIENLADQYKHFPTVIFHCMLSQSRGPKSAMTYSREMSSRAIQAENNNTEPPASQKICILQDGFGGWQQKYRNDPQLVENFDPEFWH